MKVSLRPVLIVPFVLQIFATVGLVGYLSFRNGQKAVNDLATQLRQEVADRVQQYLDTYLSRPFLINGINTNAIESGALDTQDFERAREYLWKQIQLFESVPNIGFGTEAGDFIAIERQEDGSYISKIVVRSQSKDKAIHKLDSQGDRDEFIKTVIDFDVRRRQWYQNNKNAGKPSWSDVYAWVSRDRMALNAGAPFYNENGEFQGVLATDLLLSYISNFLANLEIGRSGQVFIVEKSGNLIASSTVEQPFVNTNGEIERIRATASQDPLVSTSARYLETQFGDFSKIAQLQKIDFQIDGERQFLQVTL